MEIRLDRVLGRPVVGRNGRRIGRLEEFRTQRDGEQWTIVEYEIGAAGLLDRLGVGARLLFGRSGGGFRARWDQLNLTADGPLRLTCAVEDLQRF